MYCDQCGAYLADDAKFCSQCGAQRRALQPISDATSITHIPVPDELPVQNEHDENLRSHEVKSVVSGLGGTVGSLYSMHSQHKEGRNAKNTITQIVSAIAVFYSIYHSAYAKALRNGCDEQEAKHRARRAVVLWAIGMIAAVCLILGLLFAYQSGALRSRSHDSSARDTSTVSRQFDLTDDEGSASAQSGTNGTGHGSRTDADGGAQAGNGDGAQSDASDTGTGSFQPYDYDPKDIAGEYCRNDGACLTIGATEGDGFTDTGYYARNDITLDVLGIGYGNPIPSGATTDTLGYYTQDSLLSNLTYVPLIGSYTFMGSCEDGDTSCNPNAIYKGSGDGTPSVGITIVTQPIILYKVFPMNTNSFGFGCDIDSSNPPRQHAAYVFIPSWDDGRHQPNVISDDTVFYQYR